MLRVLSMPSTMSILSTREGGEPPVPVDAPVPALLLVLLPPPAWPPVSPVTLPPQAASARAARPRMVQGSEGRMSISVGATHGDRRAPREGTRNARRRDGAWARAGYSEGSRDFTRVTSAWIAGR
jgi:hypothetical protein